MNGTQKLLAVALAGGALVIAIILFTRKSDDPKKPDPKITETSTGVVTAPPTVTPPTSGVTSSSGSPPAITSGAPVDMETLAQEAKLVSEARALMNAGEPRKALAVIERYEKIPDRGALTPEATVIKIEAMSKSGRKTDALALAMRTRDDPKMAQYQGRIDSVLQDAGLIGEVQQPK